MDYLILLVIVVLCVVLYFTMRKSNTHKTTSNTSDDNTLYPVSQSGKHPSLVSSPTSSVIRASRISTGIQPSCGAKKPTEYPGYNNYTTYATYYH